MGASRKPMVQRKGTKYNGTQRNATECNETPLIIIIIFIFIFIIIIIIIFIIIFRLIVIFRLIANQREWGLKGWKKKKQILPVGGAMGAPPPVGF